MQRIEVPEKARRGNKMGLRDGQDIIELIADTDFIVRPTLWNPHASLPEQRRRLYYPN